MADNSGIYDTHRSMRDLHRFRRTGQEPLQHCLPTCGLIDIITHPKACGKAPVRVQTSRSF